LTIRGIRDILTLHWRVIPSPTMLPAWKLKDCCNLYVYILTSDRREVLTND